MKILRIYLRIPPCIGGMEAHIQTLTKIQRLNQIVVDLAFNDGDITKDSDIKILGKHKLFPAFATPFCFFLFYFFLVFELLCNRRKYNAIHIHGDWSSFIFAPLIKRLTKSQKVFFTLHETLRNNFIHKYLLPITLKYSDKNFTTGFECFELIKKYNKSFFQPSGVDNIFFHQKIPVQSNIDFKIVCVAHLRQIKNIELVLVIAKHLKHLTFTIIGDGPERQLLEFQKEQLNLKNVTFTGQMSKDKIASYLSENHLFLLTSLAEGTPSSVMEAMACGLPIVCSNAGGTESIVRDGVNGYVIKHDYSDVDAYIEAIKNIVDNSELWVKMSKNNIDKAESFRWDVVAKRITAEMINC